MSRPHPLLIRLAAGLGPGPAAEVTHQLVLSAFEHRVFGLLWEWIEAGTIRCDAATRDSLAAAMLHLRQQNRRVLSAASEITELLGTNGLEVAVLKGIGIEARRYPRPGCRPAGDLDLWLAPQHLHRASEAVGTLDPDHPLRSQVADLVDSRRIRSVDLRWNGFAVDLHFDPFKYGVWYSALASVWSQNEKLDQGFVVPGGAAELVISLLQLNKDRFSRLLHFADVARMSTDASNCMDAWELALDMGVDVPVASSAAVVASTLEIDLAVPPPKRGWRSILWRSIWREDTRLLGEDGVATMRRRQDWIPLFARGHLVEAMAFLLHMWFPPRPLLEHFNPQVRGQPYPMALLRARLPSATRVGPADRPETGEGYRGPR